LVPAFLGINVHNDGSSVKMMDEPDEPDELDELDESDNAERTELKDRLFFNSDKDGYRVSFYNGARAKCGGTKKLIIQYILEQIREGNQRYVNWRS
jgi:hypothetical protein